MKFAFVSVVGLLWAAAAQAGLEDKLPPEAYVDPIDQQIARTGKGISGRPFPCAYEHVEDGVDTIVSTPTDLCVKMQPQQRWRGLWRNNMEGSTFCPEPAKECPTKGGESIWLDSGPGRGGRGDLYRVDFIGRKTMYRGPYGHMGGFDQEIVMDRAIKIELIWSPSPPSKAAIESMKTECAATAKCDMNALEESLKAEAAAMREMAECKAASSCAKR
jgi:hypothetical protein